MTSIEWTRGDDGTMGVVWNPVIGCSRVSAGCGTGREGGCYAERFAHRGLSPQHRGLTVMTKHGPRWTGEVRFLPERLSEPLRWRKPRRVFVNSMSDLFHEALTNEQIAAVFGVMAAAPRHTFQVLTKRAARMREWFAWVVEQDRGKDATPGLLHCCAAALAEEARSGDESEPLHTKHCADPSGPWPLPNVWLGVSAENQATADERIPDLLACPAAVRWASYEPAIGPVDFTMLHHEGITNIDALRGHHGVTLPLAGRCAPLDWIVIGGESGPGARPFDLAWARSTIAACRGAGTKCFVKQLGAAPYVTSSTEAAPYPLRDDAADGRWPLRLRDRKGGDMSGWPADLRVREFPR